MLGMPPLCKRGTDCMNFGFVNFVRRPSVCAQPPGFDNNQPPGKVVRGKRCEMRGANISITKFTEMEWNDGVFEGSKEHRRCSGKCTVFYLFLWILIILYAKIFLSYLCFQGSKVGEIHSLWSDVEIVYFLSQSSPSIGEMMSFLRTLRNIGDVLETFYNLRFLRNDKVASIGSAIN